MKLGHRLPVGALPVAILAVLVLGPIAFGLTLDPVHSVLRERLAAPSADHLLGADHLGRDVLARVAHAFLLDVGLSLAVVAGSLVLGLGVGLAMAEFGGALDASLSFVMDVVISLPQIVVAIIFALYFGGGGFALVLALTLSGWVKYARIGRAETLRLRSLDFVDVARVIGASRFRILRRHILPNVLPQFGGLVALQFGHTILNIAALGFLGLGVQPPTPEWGAMIAEARPYIARAPWIAIAPGLFLFALTALALLVARLISPRGARTKDCDLALV